MDAFYRVIEQHFPGTLKMQAFMRQTFTCLQPYNFADENTISMIAVCRDEMNDPLFSEVMKYWGMSFNCCSLAGFVTMGKTGLAAATSHAPDNEGLKRFTFYALPHIAISRQGEIGLVHRAGNEEPSHACGALETIVRELNSGHLKLEMDMEDIEQSIVRQRILSTLKYGEKPDLVQLTKLACQIISRDVERLLGSLDASKFKFAVMTGIQIHGPFDTNWIWPQDFYVVGPDIEGGKEIVNWN